MISLSFNQSIQILSCTNLHISDKLSRAMKAESIAYLIHLHTHQSC